MVCRTPSKSTGSKGLPVAMSAVREGFRVIGFDTDLMCDINQLWSVHQAIDIGTRIESERLFWLVARAVGKKGAGKTEMLSVESKNS